MQIKINGFETPYELRELARFMERLAECREAAEEGAPAFQASRKIGPAPESAGAPPNIIFVDVAAEELSGPAIVPQPDSPDVLNDKPHGGVKRTRRTKAQIAADKLAAAPAAPAGEQLQLAVPDVPQVTHSEAPAAPLVPAAPAAPAAPPPPSTAPVAVPAPAGDAAAPATFPTLMRALSPALASQKLTAEALNVACSTAGCTNLQGLLQKQELVPTVWALVQGALS